MTAPGPEKLVVLQSFPTPRPTTNPYIVMLLRSLQEHPEVDVRTFGWRTALLGSYDIFHVHWPELLMHGRTPLRTTTHRLLFAALLLRLLLKRTTVVRTLHNLRRPSGISRLQNLLLAGLERQTTWVILLNTSAVSTIPAPNTTIIHGHYRDWFAPYERPVPVSGRLAYFGLIRPYKGVERLLETFRQLPGNAYSLTVSGQPVPPELGRRVQELAVQDDRVDLHLAYLSDADLVRVAGEAQIIVLPYLDMHNSGGSLAALSLDRPVLVPANEVNASLAAEVGEGWVYQFEGDLTSKNLEAALVAAESRSDRQPDLSRRNWHGAGEQHATVYRSARERRLTRRP